MMVRFSFCFCSLFFLMIAFRSHISKPGAESFKFVAARMISFAMTGTYISSKATMALSNGLQSLFEFWLKTFSQYSSNASSARGPESFLWSANLDPKLGLFLNICWTFTYCWHRQFAASFFCSRWWLTVLINSQVLDSTLPSYLNSKFCLTYSRVFFFVFFWIVSEIHLSNSMLMVDFLTSFSSFGSVSVLNSSSVIWLEQKPYFSINFRRPTTFSK